MESKQPRKEIKDTQEQDIRTTFVPASQIGSTIKPSGTESFDKASEKSREEVRKQKREEILNNPRDKFMRKNKMEMEIVSESSKAAELELEFIHYLKNDFFGHLQDYPDADYLMLARFDFSIQAVLPAIREFMNNLLKKKIVLSKEQFDSKIEDLLLKNKEVLDKSILNKLDGSQSRSAFGECSNDIQCWVEYREIDLNNDHKELKPFLIDFINSFTGREINLPGKGMKRYPLVEKIHIRDAYGPWNYDHLQGCIHISFRHKQGGTLPNPLKFEKDFFKNNSKEMIIFVPNIQGSKNDDPIMSLENFLEEVASVNRKDRNYVHTWLDELKENEVDTLEEIIAWDEKDWETARLKTNGKKLIRKHLDEIRFLFDTNMKKESEEEEKPFSTAEKYSVMHRIKRFLIWKTRPNELINFGYLDERALELGFKEIEGEFYGHYLLTQLKSFYETYSCKKSHSKSLKFPTGMLLYGPPGTGKTVLTKTLPTLMGLTPVCDPISASDLNRELVGQTERLLREIIARSAKIPYLYCYFAVDEIDGLAPKKDEKSSQHRIDALNTLLSCIGGITGVENFMLLGSTNYPNKMDEALKRRMPGQFCVGKPSPEARKKMIQKADKINLSPNMIDELVHLTTNFSGAALVQCISDIVVETKKYNELEHLSGNESLEYHKLTEIAAKTSKQFNIRLGNYSLPELFERQKKKENPLNASFLDLLEKNDNQVVLSFKTKTVEILYRRYRTVNAPSAISTSRSRKIVELGRVNLIMNNWIENLLSSTQPNYDSEAEFIVDYINIFDHVSHYTKSEIHSYLSKKVGDFEKTAASSKKKCILVWLDLLEQNNCAEQKINPKFIQSWFEANQTRLGSKNNLYHFYIANVSNCPRLLEIILWKGLTYVKKNEIPFTGRILVDLSDSKPEMTFEVEGKGNADLLYREPLLHEKVSATNSSQAIPKLVEFSSERGIEFILLLDLDFLLANNAFDESKVKENITEKMQEFNGYPKSLLIVDVDSLVGMIKSVSESSMGISTSYNLTDNRLYSMILHYARSLAQISPISESWVALISKNKELSKMLKKDLQWPMTLEEIGEVQREEKMQEETRCLRCGDIYIEAKNELTQCVYHDGFIFEFSAPPSEWTMIENESEAKELALNKTLINLKSEPNAKKDVQFLYICCLKPLDSPGCKKYKHQSDSVLCKQADAEIFDEYYEKFGKLIAKNT